MPPKWLSIAPPVLPAPLRRKVERTTEIAAELELMIAPPCSSAQPSCRVRSANVTEAPSAAISKRRSRPCTCTGAPAFGIPPSTMVEPAPAPRIATLPVMSRSPFASRFWFSGGISSLYVPAGSEIASAPERAFVSWIAARSVHAPAAVLHAPSPMFASTASTVLVTVKTAPSAPNADDFSPKTAASATATATALTCGRPRCPSRRRGGTARPPALSPEVLVVVVHRPIVVSAPTRGLPFPAGS